MKRKASPARLTALFTYDPETGVLTWKERPRSEFKRDQDCNAWNSTNAGRVAGCVHSTLGYQIVGVDRAKMYAHHIAWAVTHGRHVVGQIDHINGVKADNRLTNLREIPQAENKKNQKRYSTNTSGATGVGRAGERWFAQIRANGKTKRLGVFDTFEEAVRARRIADVQFGFHPNHGRAA